jgi:hypothetical protein
MSLRHWWPLNGDLNDKVGGNHMRYVDGHNKGYIVINNNGKIGSCYERTIVG